MATEEQIEKLQDLGTKFLNKATDLNVPCGIVMWVNFPHEPSELGSAFNVKGNTLAKLIDMINDIHSPIPDYVRQLLEEVAKQLETDGTIIAKSKPRNLDPSDN